MNMYLDKILGSKTKINVLATLVSNPKRTYVEKELAIESGANHSEVNRQIPDLVGSGLLIMQKMAKVKIYQINTEHFLYKPLEQLFKDLISVYIEAADEITQFITQEHEIECVLLLGSLARKKIREDIVKEPSDIDLLIITDQNKAVEKNLTTFINTKISRKYGIAVYPIVLTTKEYLEGLKDKPLITEAHSSGEVIYGKKPKRFV
jgi:predicted nucleotidyltransferase